MPEELPLGPQTGRDLLAIAESLGNWIFTGFLIFATVLIVLAAFQFVKGGGDPTQVAAARKNIIFAIIGVIIALLSKGIITVIVKIVGA